MFHVNVERNFFAVWPPPLIIACIEMVCMLSVSSTIPPMALSKQSHIEWYSLHVTDDFTKYDRPFVREKHLKYLNTRHTTYIYIYNYI